MSLPSLVRHQTHRIAVVDDHSIIRAIFRSLAEDDENLNLVWTATCLKDAITSMNEDPPDLLVLDVSLPDGTGFDLLPFAASNYPKTRIMMVSSHEEREYAQKAHDLGAQGYLTKNASAQELTQAIHVVLENKTYFKPGIVFQKTTARSR